MTDELNYQCSCGICFFLHDKDLIEEHHKLTNHTTGKTETISSVVEKIINDNYAVLLAFDVVDGNLSFKDYCRQLTQRRIGSS